MLLYINIQSSKYRSHQNKKLTFFKYTPIYILHKNGTNMKKTLLTLLLSSINLFAYSLVGTWSIDEAKTKASLKASSLNSNELRFIERFILHTMKTMECTDAHTCLIPEQYKSNPTTGKYTWTSQGVDYLLKGNNKPLLVEHTHESSIKMTTANMNNKKLTIYFNKTKNNVVTTPKETTPITTPQKPQVIQPTVKQPEQTKPIKHTIQKPILKQSSVTTSKAHKTDKHIKVNKTKKEHTPKERIVNIDLDAEKAAAKQKADNAYLEAIQDVM